MRNITSVAAVRRGTLWIAVTAAVSVAAIAMASVVVAAVLNNHPATLRPVAGFVSPEPTVAAASAASPSASPVATPPAVAVAAMASPFVCGAATLTAQNAPAVTPINALRTAAHAGYDRLTVQFSGGRPGSVELRPQSGAGFTQGASGRPMTLAGTNGVLVVIHGADLHTGYHKSTDIKTGYRALARSS